MMRVAKDYGLAKFCPVKFAFRRTFCAIVVALAMGLPPAWASVPLAGLGSANFTIVYNTMSYTQSPTNTTLSSSFILGDLIAGQFASSYNWSGISSFGLLMSAPDASPNATFTVEFYDASENRINSYQGAASGLTSSAVFVPITLSLSGNGNLSTVAFLQFTWDSPGSGSVVLQDVARAAMSVLWSSSGGSAWLAATNWTGGAVPASGDIAQFGLNPTSGATPVGIDMGSNGGAQSVGAIEVTSARSAALTVVNSAASASGMLTLNGATVNGTQNVILRNNSSQLLTLADGLTVELEIVLGNATNNVVAIDGAGGITVSSIISGFGRSLTKAGSGAGFLTLGGSNTFSGATTVSAGTLRLNSATGGALGSTASVAVASGATLLLSQSNQVNDGAAVSLSGGTITRGAGVSETFGNLTVTGSGFIDFGTGAVGELRFGTYTPSALLTVNNFLPGNKLVFVDSNLSASINNTSLFSFQGAFESTWNSGTSTFTITAIPEASTWFAAVLLVSLCAGGFWHTANGMRARSAR
jgi:autotransporter-associated beta strand protein